jgi:hypothetical protein
MSFSESPELQTLQNDLVKKAVNESVSAILSMMNLSDAQKNEILNVVDSYAIFSSQNDPTLSITDSAIIARLLNAKDANELSSQIAENLNGSVFKTLLSYGLSNLSSIKLSIPDINKIVNAASFSFVAVILEFVDKVTNANANANANANPDYSESCKFNDCPFV